MRERPILFSGPMVRAILAGNKTQTRRAVKEPISGWLNNANGSHKVMDGQVFNYSFDQHLGNCPYGKPGDRLWVRETWAFGIHALAAKRDEDGPFVYAADGTTHGRLCERWRPSIHMPRHACRLMLEITGVRVERLNDISEEDVDAECFGGDYPTRVLPDLFPGHPDDWSHLSMEQCFQRLWESINGPGSWDANPWVWVVEFRVLHPRTDGGGRG
ncbi:hypothetical protein YH64_009140 [Achromobacter sp. LC458]|uniref:hypothetical protein n=1 Tax=Achromobacter sp. LC458 TaxID=1120623 RepID=UPI00062A1E2C|nr:hypothetical protein [Achromobacter sp. LC458]TRM53255.1 hypothetical protein YH64_009140 [Achromobacter sp. LC458]